MSKEITVYWSPAAFTLDESSWNMLYRPPESLLNNYIDIKSSDQKDNIFSCPSSNNFLKNIFVVKSNLKDNFVFSDGQLKEINESFNGTKHPIQNLNNKIDFSIIRKSPFIGYTSLKYNMEWMFFADEPVEARFTAPYYPPFSPIENSILTSGEFDIGQWFRPWTLEYVIPHSSNEFKIDVNDPIFYIEIMTDKKVKFKRFNLTKELKNIVYEFVQSTSRYGKFLPLYKRYEMAKNSKITDIVLKEIKNNLVD